MKPGNYTFGIPHSVKVVDFHIFKISPSDLSSRADSCKVYLTPAIHTWIFMYTFVPCALTQKL